MLLKLNFYSIQQVNSIITLPHLPRLIDTRHNRICHINKSTEKKTYMQFLFELLKINFCRIQQVNSEITPPLHPRFINKRQNMPYQQVNGEKKPYIQFFWVAKAKFLFNSTSQQPNPTPLFIKVRLHVPIQQINKRKRPIHKMFEFVFEKCFVLNSTSQQQNHTTPSPKIYRYKTEYSISTSQLRIIP